MRRIVLAAALFALATFAHADDSQDVAANRALAQAFADSWNSHDMDAPFRKILHNDVAWVSVSGDYPPGSGGIENVVKGHVRVHATPKFKDSVIRITRVDAVLLAPNVGLVHVLWALTGDRDNDGTPRPPRDGVFTWVTLKEDGAWKIRACQNTNHTPIK